MRKILIVLLLLTTILTYAQDEVSNPVPITSENITSLQSVTQLNFDADVFDDAQINIGWFAQSENLETFLLLNGHSTILIARMTDDISQTLSFPNVIDIATFYDNHFALLYSIENGFGISYINAYDNQQNLNISVMSDSMPSAIWVTCENITCTASVEAFNNDGSIAVIKLPEFDTRMQDSQEITMSIEDLTEHPYIPALNEQAVVRIGRIPLPYVVTSSLDGMVQLWNLSVNQLLYEIDNGTGEPSVFGNINADATHLVWRNNANETLYLLNFETGENREIASLNGDYAQWYFLSNDASVIIAVNLGGEPNVVAWDTATGERTLLGEYRHCERPQPDMVRLSSDGSTLVIGCDTGLDIWQIAEEE